MARKNLPAGFVLSGKPGSRTQILNPATGKPFADRTLYNPVTGEAIPRRQWESPAIRQALGLAPGVGAFEAKAKQRKQQLYPLPRKQKVYYSKMVNGKRTREVWEGRAKYRFHTLAGMLRGIHQLPPNTIVWISVYARNRYPSASQSPTFYGAKSKRGRRLREDRLRWMTPLEKGSKILAGDIDRYVPGIQIRLEDVYDVKAFDVVTIGTV